MAGARDTAAAAAGPVIISFAGYNRAWAAWIAGRLERHGVRVTLQRWDMNPGDTVKQRLSDLLLAEGTVLVVLSEWYFRLGPRTHEEWNAALREVVPPNSHRFAAVSVTSASLPSAAASLAAAELWGLGAAEAERRLLGRLGITPVRRPAQAGAGDSLVGLGGGPRFPLEQPAVWGGVPRRNTRFTGRESLLWEIQQRLTQAEPGAGVVTLYGLSGVGKTQIAAEYVYRFGAENYDVVWWVRAAERGTLREKLAGLAPALGLTTGREYGERLRAVRDALRRGTPYARWLVVLDGADQPEDIHDLVPAGPGHVLITSQNREWGEYNSSSIEVPVYDRMESIAFVRRRAPRLDDSDANKLADALGDLALALDQNAGALNDSTMPVDEYIELLSRGADVESGLKVGADFQMTYYTAFSILLNRLREDKPEAVDLLRLCVFFAPGPVPARLLRDLPIRDLPEQLTGLLEDSVLWSAAVAKLSQWSVVQADPQETEPGEPGTGDVIQMHRLVYQAVRADMPQAEQETYSRVVRRILAVADPGRPTDTRLWPRYAEIVPHLEASGALRSTNPEIQLTVLNCLSYLHESGEYRTGLRLAATAAESWPQFMDRGQARLWDLYFHRSNLVRAIGDFNRSESLDREAYEYLLTDRGDSDVLTLRAGGSLAADLRGLGRYPESLDLSESVRAGYADLLGDQDIRTLRAQNNIAVSLRLLGDYTGAVDLDRKTLEACREILRARNPMTLASETNYALDLRLLGQYDQATSVQERSCEVHRTVLGQDNPQTLAAELNLAICYRRTGDRPRAAQLLARLMERCERVLGDDDPLTVRTAAALSGMEREHGDLDRARELGESALRHYTRQFGPDHPFATGTRANHGLLLRAAGERQQSQLVVEEALAAMTRALGADHPWTLGCALNASAARNLAGEPENAADLSHDTAVRAAARLGPRHPLTLSCRIAYATDLRNLRRRHEADKIEEEALAALAATLGPQHPHTVSARSRTRPHWDFEPFPT